MLRVRTIFTSALGGSPFMNTLYFGGAGTQANADACVADVGTFWGAVDAQMDNETSWATEAEVAEIQTSGTLTGTFATTPQTGTGGVAGSALPKASQGLIRLFTGAFISGRRLRGRIFVPSLTTTAINNGVLAAATVTALQNAINALIASANSELTIWSKTNSQTASVSSAAVWNELAVLRSRRP